MSAQAISFSPATLPSPLQFPSSATSNVKIHDGASLAQKTVFLKVRFGMLGNSRKVAGAEVLDTDADKGLLKVQKTLLDSKELDAIRKADGQMRTWLDNTCLPFERGISLLPLGLIETAQERLTQYQAERSDMVASFIQAYPALCADASKHLGSLFKQADYPAVNDILSRFTFDWQYISFQVPGQLPSDIFKAEQQKAAAQMDEAVQSITLLMRERLLEMVSHLQAKLTPGDDGKPRILRDTAVTNLQEFLSTFDLRNVTDDKELAAIVDKAKLLISGTSAARLRNSDLWREKIRSGMANITTSLSGMVEEKTGRKYRTE